MNRYFNKYNNNKVTIDGIEFDSKKEARRYQELKLLEQAGEIQGLELQKEYVLIPSQREPDIIGKRGGVKKGKVIEQAVKYIADFVYIENGEEIVEDVKGYRGNTGAYNVFVIKRKLMLQRFGIRIREI